MASFDLDSLITKIKTFALANGFIAVDAYKFNTNSNPDTALPKLFIKTNNVEIDKFLNGYGEFQYKIDLIIIIAAANTKPAIEIINKVRVLLRALFVDTGFFSDINFEGKIEFDGFQLTDDQEEYSRYGGASGNLSIRILNTEKI